jgi:predicted DNA-binding protein (MmcQ/YjbR family)
MDLQELREYCISKKGVTEELPFGPNTLVFKVLNKAFVLTGVNDENLTFNVKCDPELAMELREKYDFVQPGFHMNKKHWNTVTYNRSNSKLLKQFVDQSYDLVLQGIPKSKREGL